MSSYLRLTAALIVLSAMNVLSADSLRVSVNTSCPPGGGYGTSYQVIIWVQDALGAFVKTFGRWGNETNSSDLPVWNSKQTVTTVDGTTGATCSGSTLLSAKWNCTNTSNATVANGTYTVCIELSTGHSAARHFYAQTAVNVNGSTSTKTLLDSISTGFASYITNFSGTYRGNSTKVESALPGAQILTAPNGFTIPAGFATGDIAVRLFSVNGRLLSQQTLQSRASSPLMVQYSQLLQNSMASGVNYVTVEFNGQRIVRPFVMVK